MTDGSSGFVTTRHVDYLRHTNPDFRIDQALPVANGERSLWRINSVGQVAKLLPSERGPAPARRSTEDMLVALYGYNSPLAFVLNGTPEGVTVNMGTWLSAHTSGLVEATAQQPQLRSSVSTSPDADRSPEASDPGQSFLLAALESQYAAVVTTRVDGATPSLPRVGLGLGIPTPKPADPVDGALPVDRLIRAMARAQWACLVLAQPVEGRAIRDLRNLVINELRATQAATKALTAPSPLGDQYSDLLRALLRGLSAGEGGGAWRTAVYLLGDDESYPRLAALWQGIFSGAQSLPEPVRTYETPIAKTLADGWMTPNAPTSEPDTFGHYRRPFEHQTLLSSTQLAAYVHLPSLETGGFSISLVPSFDVVPTRVSENVRLAIGRVYERGRPTGADYEISRNALAAHTFVTGVTGQGKTRTVFRLLRQAAAVGIKALVIEPAKTEYRSLLGDRDIRDLQIFTVGDEKTSPLRLNPFEFPDGISVGVHLDLLRSVFSASFGMWTPMPQILEQCLYEIYAARGWDIAADENSRSSGSRHTGAFPTLSDLVAVIPRVVQQQGFDPEARDRILASLRTRLNALRTGAKGRMLDVQQSLSAEELFERNTLIELESIGDDDEKAFIMGLLFIRLVEHRRAVAHRVGLSDEVETRHLLVIEEAHRLLANSPRSLDEEQSDPRGKAVETFANLLAEIRAYGQGIIVVDQVPTKLAPDVIKNTNLKIAHRIVSGDDREVLAKAMVMNDQQSLSLASLVRRQAVIFGEGDDGPVLVRVGEESKGSSPEPAEIVASGARGRYPELFTPTPACVGLCSVAQTQVCDYASTLADDEVIRNAVSRVMLTAIESPGGLGSLWNDLAWEANGKAPPGILGSFLLHCLSVRAAAWFARHRGAQLGWTHDETQEFEQVARSLLLELSAGSNSKDVIGQFQQVALQRYRRTEDPYRRCSQICTQPGPVCLYRTAAADLIENLIFTQDWGDARVADDFENTQQSASAWGIARAAAWRLLAFRDEVTSEETTSATEAGQRAALCFAQQMIAQERGRHPREAEAILDSFLDLAKDN
jgi:DNA helicase HerA-like ATPase